jgi:hypothetical protein
MTRMRDFSLYLTASFKLDVIVLIDILRHCSIYLFLYYFDEMHIFEVVFIFNLLEAVIFVELLM